MKTYTGYEVTTASADLPISMDLAYQQLRHDGYDCDATLIETLIEAAVNWIESQYGIAIMTQTILEYHSAFPDNLEPIFLRTYPANTVLVKYIKDGGLVDLTGIDDEWYSIQKNGGHAVVTLNSTKAWPTDADDVSSPVQITITSGFAANPTEVPRNISAAILLLLSQLYQNRENPDINIKTSAVGMLLRPYEKLNVA